MPLKGLYQQVLYHMVYGRRQKERPEEDTRDEDEEEDPESLP